MSEQSLLAERELLAANPYQALRSDVSVGHTKVERVAKGRRLRSGDLAERPRVLRLDDEGQRLRRTNCRIEPESVHPIGVVVIGETRSSHPFDARPELAAHLQP